VLANNLFCGSLPDVFLDLTWVEEQVCALYQSMAIITRLYGSDDPQNSHVYCRNTCAFAQNVVSTAQVLPQTPSNVSVVFVGSSKTVPESALRNVFQVLKGKDSRVS
jgi:hypothetical protein